MTVKKLMKILQLYDPDMQVTIRAIEPYSDGEQELSTIIEKDIHIEDLYVSFDGGFVECVYKYNDLSRGKVEAAIVIETCEKNDS